MELRFIALGICLFATNPETASDNSNKHAVSTKPALVPRGRLDEVSSPSFFFACPGGIKSQTNMLKNGFGKTIFQENLKGQSPDSKGRCQTRLLGEQIEPPLVRYPCRDDPNDNKVPACYKPPKYRGLSVGRYYLEVKAEHADGRQFSEKVEFDIKPAIQTDLTDASRTWRAVRGEWRAGLAGVNGTLKSVDRPAYLLNPRRIRVGDADRSADITSYEVTMLPGCFDASCEMGIALGLRHWNTTPEGIEHWTALTAVVTGDSKVKIQRVVESTGGLQVTPILGPLDVSAHVSGSTDIKLRIEYMDDWFSAFAVYVNDRFVTCERLKSGYYRDVTAGLALLGKKANVSTEFSDFTVRPSRWNMVPMCFYNME